MGFKIAAVCRPLLMTPPQKAVLMDLAYRARDGDGFVFPSIPRICEDTCFARTAVIEAIAWIEARGWLHVQRRRGEHNRYWLDGDVLRREFERARAAALAQESAGAVTCEPVC